MNVYRIRDLSSDDHQVTDSFAGTMKLARQEVKETPVVFRGSIQVDLVSVKTDKGGLLALLARRPEIAVLRSWRGTNRGGLRAIPTDFQWRLGRMLTIRACPPPPLLPQPFAPASPGRPMSNCC
jgi:hypothetical protein